MRLAQCQHPPASMQSLHMHSIFLYLNGNQDRIVHRGSEPLICCGLAATFAATVSDCGLCLPSRLAARRSQRIGLAETLVMKSVCGKPCCSGPCCCASHGDALRLSLAGLQAQRQCRHGTCGDRRASPADSRACRVRCGCPRRAHHAALTRCGRAPGRHVRAGRPGRGVPGVGRGGGEGAGVHAACRRPQPPVHAAARAALLRHPRRPDGAQCWG